jgi:flagellar FliL protein
VSLKGLDKHLIALLLMLLPSGVWAADDEVPASTRYIEIEPVFVTNYGGLDRLAYMKVQVTLRVLGAEGEAQVKHHMPNIKDTLLSLFAIQTNETISSAEGKEGLRKQSHQAVVDVLTTEDELSHLEDLLFTSFVAQR